MDDETKRINADEQIDDTSKPDLPASTLIGANITAINAGTGSGGLVAPAATAAANEEVREEVADDVQNAASGLNDQDEGDDMGPIDLDAIAQFGSGAQEAQAASTDTNNTGTN